MNILLVNTTKMVGDTGGLAKVTCAFANEMKKRGHQVSLIYADERSGEFFFPIDKDIAIYDIRNMDGNRIKFPLWLRLKREILRTVSKSKSRNVNTDFFERYLVIQFRQAISRVNPEVIVSFQPASTKLLKFDLQVTVPVITMSHGNPEDYFISYPESDVRALEASDVNQVLLPSFAGVMKDHFPNSHIVTIGNVVPSYAHKVDLVEPKERYKILFLARLSKGHKRPHLLIEAFSKLANQYQDWDLDFWGADDGKAYKKQLELMVKKAGLENRIHFKGLTRDVEGILASGDIYAMMSANEGFGLSMGEAMSKGLPVVACDSWLGVSDMVQDGCNGVLVKDDPESIAVGLKRLMDNPSLRSKLGRQAALSMERFAPDIIWSRWENLLKGIVRK